MNYKVYKLFRVLPLIKLRKGEHMRKTVLALLTVFFVFFATIVSANVSTIAAGSSATCLRASWVIENLSETEATTVHINVGPIGYSWNKNFDRTLSPGGFLSNALEPKSTFKNKGPGAIKLNCQRHRVESSSRVEWKKDPGSQKTYQSNYHMDHVKPSLYIEPGMGQPEGTERGLFSVRGGMDASGSGGATGEANR